MLKLTIATLAATLNAAPETAANETCGPRLPMKRLQYACPVSKTIQTIVFLTLNHLSPKGCHCSVACLIQETLVHIAL